MQQSARPLSSRTALWGLLHSLWIGWTFTILFNWLAFAYIGIRVRRPQWTLLASIYASPLVVFAVFSAAPQRWIGDAALAVALASGIFSIVHAFWIRKEYLIHLDMLGYQVSSVSTTSRGKRWERLHSLWMLWTLLFGFTSWIAFMYIGVRVRRVKWVVWGMLYLALFLAFAISEPVFGRQSEITEAITSLFIVFWVASVVHAFSARPNYLVELESRSGEVLRPRGIVDSTPQTERGVQSKEAPKKQTERDAATSGRLLTAKKGTEQPRSTSSPRAANAPMTSKPEHDVVGVSGAYPLPLAYGWSLLEGLWDPRDRYREQLRHAENMLAFLGSISLALLDTRTYDKAGIDLSLLWRGGMSFGRWKTLVQLNSKAFRATDHPLESSIRKLKIGSEKNGFGADVARLISMRNDYHHGRGPFVEEDVAAASDEAQDRLERCMESLSFLAGYPIRLIQDFDVDRNGDRFSLKCLRLVGDGPGFPQEGIEVSRALPRGDLALDKGDGEWISLYPFLVASNCPRCRHRETYFIDGWDHRKGLAFMKSFERGHLEERSNVSEALTALVAEQNAEPTAVS